MARSQMMIQTNLSLADSWFLVFTSNIVELDSVVIEVVEDGEAVF